MGLAGAEHSYQAFPSSNVNVSYADASLTALQASNEERPIESMWAFDVFVDHGNSS